MRRPLRLFTVMIALLMTLVGSQTANAQSERADCPAMAQSVAAGRATNLQLQLLTQCPESGAGALATVWSRARGLTPQELTTLVRSSSKLADGRLYRAVLAASDDPQQPAAARVGALIVLTSYYEPSTALSIEYLSSARVGDPLPASTSGGWKRGASPVPSSLARDLLALVYRLARHDADSTVRRAALRLRQSFAYGDAEHTPLDADAVQLQPGCGPRVTLQSNADIALALRLRVLGTTFDRPVPIKAASNGKPASMLFALPVGTVVVTYGSRELARLTDRNAPCPPGVTKR